MIPKLNRLCLYALAFAIAFAVCLPAAHAGCRQFVRAHYVQQFVAVPQILYLAGTDLQADALADKVARLAQQKLSAAQPQTQPLAAPQTGILAQKCASCHQEGGKAFSIADGFTRDQWTRWLEMASYGVDVPPAMKPLIEKLKADGSGPDVTDAVYQSIKQPAGGLE